MNTLIVIITPDCEELLATCLEAEIGASFQKITSKNGSGTVKIGYNHDGHPDERELTAAEEQALNTNRSVIAYWTT